MDTRFKKDKLNELNKKVSEIKLVFDNLIKKFNELKKINSSAFSEKTNSDICNNINILQENIFLSLSKIEKKREIDYVLSQLTQNIDTNSKSQFLDSFKDFTNNSFSSSSFDNFVNLYQELINKKRNFLDFLNQIPHSSKEIKYENINNEINEINSKIRSFGYNLEDFYSLLSEKQKEIIQQLIYEDKSIDKNLELRLFSLKKDNLDNKEFLNFNQDILHKFNDLYFSLKQNLENIISNKENFLSFIDEKKQKEILNNSFVQNDVFTEIDLKIDQIKWEYNFKLFELKNKYESFIKTKTILNSSDSELELKVLEIEKLILVLLNEKSLVIKNELKSYMLSKANSTNNSSFEFSSINSKNNNENNDVNDYKIISEYESSLENKFIKLEKNLSDNLFKIENDNNLFLNKLEEKINNWISINSSEQKISDIHDSFKSFSESIVNEVNNLKSIIDSKTDQFYKDNQKMTEEFNLEIQNLKEINNKSSEESSRIILDKLDEAVVLLKKDKEEINKANLNLLNSIISKNDEDKKYIKLILKQINSRNESLTSELESSKLMLHNARLMELEELIASQNRELMNLQNDKNDVLSQIENVLKTKNNQEKLIEKVSRVESDINSIYKEFEIKIASLENSFIDKFKEINDGYFRDIKIEQSEMTSNFSKDVFENISNIETKLLVNFDEIKNNLFNNIALLHEQITDLKNEENEKNMDLKISNLISTVEEIRKTEDLNVFNKISIDDFKGILASTTEYTITPKLDQYQMNQENLNLTLLDSIKENKKNFFDELSRISNDIKNWTEQQNDKIENIDFQIKNDNQDLLEKMESISDSLSTKIDEGLSNFESKYEDFINKNNSLFLSVIKKNEIDKKSIQVLLKEINEKSLALGTQLENSKVMFYNSKLTELDELINRQNQDILNIAEEKNNLYNEINRVLSESQKRVDLDNKLDWINEEIKNISNDFTEKVSAVEINFVDKLRELNNDYSANLENVSNKNLAEISSAVFEGISEIEKKLVLNYDEIKTNTLSVLNNLFDKIEDLKEIAKTNNINIDDKIVNISKMMNELKEKEEENSANILTSSEVKEIFENFKDKITYDNENIIASKLDQYTSYSDALNSSLLEKIELNKKEFLEEITAISNNLRNLSQEQQVTIEELNESHKKENQELINKIDSLSSSISNEIDQKMLMFQQQYEEFISKNKDFFLTLIKNNEHDKKYIKTLLKEINEKSLALGTQLENSKVMFYNSKLTELDELINRQNQDILNIAEEKNNLYNEINRVLVESQKRVDLDNKLDWINEEIKNISNDFTEKVSAVEINFVDKLRELNNDYSANLENVSNKNLAEISSAVFEGISEIEKKLVLNYDEIKTNTLSVLNNLFDKIEDLKEIAKTNNINIDDKIVNISKMMNELKEKEEENSANILTSSEVKEIFENFKDKITYDNENIIASKLDQYTSYSDALNSSLLEKIELNKKEFLEEITVISNNLISLSQEQQVTIEELNESHKKENQELIDKIDSLSSSISSELDQKMLMFQQQYEEFISKNKDFFLTLIKNNEHDKKYIKTLLKEINEKSLALGTQLENSKVMFYNSKLTELDELINRQNQDILNIAEEKNNLYNEINRVLAESQKRVDIDNKLDWINEEIKNISNDFSQKLVNFENDFIKSLRSMNGEYSSNLLEISDQLSNKINDSSSKNLLEISNFIFGAVSDIEKKLVDNYDGIKDNVIKMLNNVFEQINFLKESNDSSSFNLDEKISSLSNLLNEIKTIEEQNANEFLTSREVEKILDYNSQHVIDQTSQYISDSYNKISDELRNESNKLYDRFSSSIKDDIFTNNEYVLEKVTNLLKESSNFYTEIINKISKEFDVNRTENKALFKKSFEFFLTLLKNNKEEQKNIKELLQNINFKSDKISNEIELSRVMVHNEKLLQLDELIRKQDEDFSQFLNEKSNFYSEIEKVLKDNKNTKEENRIIEIQKFIENKYLLLDSKITDLEDKFIDNFKLLNNDYIADIKNHNLEISNINSKSIIGGINEVENKIIENFNLMKSNLFLSVQEIYDQINFLKTQQLTKEELNNRLVLIASQLEEIRNFEKDSLLANLSLDEFKDIIRDQSYSSIEVKMQENLSSQEKFKDHIILSNENSKKVLLEEIEKVSNVAKDMTDKLTREINSTVENQKDYIISNVSKMLDESNEKSKQMFDQFDKNIEDKFSKFEQQQISFLKETKIVFAKVISSNNQDKNIIKNLLKQINNKNNELTSSLENAKLMFHNSKLMEVEELLNRQNNELFNLIQDKKDIYELIEKIISTRKDSETQSKKLERVENEIKNISTGLESKIDSMQQNFIEKFNNINNDYFNEIRQENVSTSSTIAKNVFENISYMENKILNNFDLIKNNFSISIKDVADKVSEINNSLLTNEDIDSKFLELATEINKIKEIESQSFINQLTKDDLDDLIKINSIQALEPLIDSSNRKIVEEIYEIVSSTNESQKDKIRVDIENLVQSYKNNAASLVNNVLEAIEKQSDFIANSNDIIVNQNAQSINDLKDTISSEFKNFENKQNEFINKNKTLIKLIFNNNYQDKVYIKSLLKQINDKSDEINNELNSAKLMFHNSKLMEIDELIAKQNSEIVELINEKNLVYDLIEKTIKNNITKNDTIKEVRLIYDDVVSLSKNIDSKIDVMEKSFIDKFNAINREYFEEIKQNNNISNAEISKDIFGKINDVESKLLNNFDVLKNNISLSILDIAKEIKTIDELNLTSNEIVEKLMSLANQIEQLKQIESESYFHNINQEDFKNMVEVSSINAIEPIVNSSNRQIVESIFSLVNDSSDKQRDETIDAIANLLTQQESRSKDLILDLSEKNSIDNSKILSSLSDNFASIKEHSENLSLSFYSFLDEFKLSTEKLILSNQNWVKKILLGNNKSIVRLQSAIDLVNKNFSIMGEELESSKLAFYNSKIDELEALLLVQSNELMNLIDEKKTVYTEIENAIIKNKEMLSRDKEIFDSVENSIINLASKLENKIDIKYEDFVRQIKDLDESQFKKLDLVLQDSSKPLIENINQVKIDLVNNYKLIRKNLMITIQDVCALFSSLRQELPNREEIESKINYLIIQIKDIFDSEERSYLDSLSEVEINNLLETKIYKTVEPLIEKYTSLHVSNIKENTRELLEETAEKIATNNEKIVQPIYELRSVINDLEESVNESNKNLELKMSDLISVFQIKTLDAIEKTSLLLENFLNEKRKSNSVVFSKLAEIKNDNLTLKNSIFLALKQISLNSERVNSRIEHDFNVVLNSKLASLEKLIELQNVEINNLIDERERIYDEAESIVLKAKESKEDQSHFIEMEERFSLEINRFVEKMNENFDLINKSIEKIKLSDKENNLINLDSTDPINKKLVLNSNVAKQVIIDDFIRIKSSFLNFYKHLKDLCDFENNEINQNDLKKINYTYNNDLKSFDRDILNYIQVFEKKKREIEIFYKKLRDLRHKKGGY